MKLLLTGSDGFVGRHVLQALGGTPLGGNPGEAEAFVDLRDQGAVRKAVEAALAREAPDAVLHLAAQSHVGESFADPDTTWAVNFQGTYHLLSALGRSGFTGRVLYISSGAVHGTVPESDLPVRETQPLRPDNPYAASKAAAEALCHQWSRTGPFQVVIARPFNHVGPGQGRGFALSGFAAQLVEIGRGLCDPVLHTGDLSVTRDFTDVRDVVRAYGLLLERGRNGTVYNVCSGQERALGDILDALIAAAAAKGITAGHDVRHQVDPERLRPIDQPRMCGDPGLLRQDTGWTPGIPWEDTLVDILNDWERKIT